MEVRLFSRGGVGSTNHHFNLMVEASLLNVPRDWLLSGGGKSLVVLSRAGGAVDNKIH